MHMARTWTNIGVTIFAVESSNSDYELIAHAANPTHAHMICAEHNREMDKVITPAPKPIPFDPPRYSLEGEFPMSKPRKALK
jgi:hypothetical protein